MTGTARSGGEEMEEVSWELSRVIDLILKSD